MLVRRLHAACTPLNLFQCFIAHSASLHYERQGSILLPFARTSWRADWQAR